MEARLASLKAAPRSSTSCNLTGKRTRTPAVLALLIDSATQIWVTKAVAGPVGFVVAKVIDTERRIGEWSTMAVDPLSKGEG